MGKCHGGQLAVKTLVVVAVVEVEFLPGKSDAVGQGGVDYVGKPCFVVVSV